MRPGTGGTAVEGADPLTAVGVFDTEGAIAEDAVKGALAGAAVGALAGAALAALAPGAAPVLLGGTLAEVAAGAAAGVTAGGAIGTLVGLGVSEEEARVYDKQLCAGRTLVTIRAGVRFAEAAAILDRCGAYAPDNPNFPVREPMVLP